MSYLKKRTKVNGKTAEGKQIFAILHGHWKKDSVAKWARNKGAVNATMEHGFYYSHRMHYIFEGKNVIDIFTGVDLQSRAFDWVENNLTPEI